MNHPQLDVLRRQLDDLDGQLISLLAERFKITDLVGIYKSQHNLDPIDSIRERSQQERIRSLAHEYSVDVALANRIMRLVINEVVKRHKMVREQCE